MINDTATDIYNYDSIPAKMKALAQWGAWTFVDQKDKNGNPKKDKIPIDVKSGHAAKSNDPSTWATFEEAIRYLQKENTCGLAFFTKEPADESELWIYGVDLDDAIEI